MSGHCPKCGDYTEEDESRLCSSCASKSLTAEETVNELRAAVLVLATEIRLRIIEREALVMGEPDAWIKRSAVLKFVVEERLAHPIAKAAVERAGGDLTPLTLLRTDPTVAKPEGEVRLCYPFSTETCDRTGCTCRDDAREASQALDRALKETP